MPTLSHADAEAMQFRLSGSPTVKGGVLLLAMFTACGIVGVLLTLLVTDDAERSVTVAGLLLALVFAVVLGAFTMTSGVVRITDDQLQIRTLVDRQLLDWMDMTTARLRTVSDLGRFDRLLSRLAGSGTEHKLVEITLKRPYRLALMPWQRSGPDAIGPPALPSKSMRLFVSEPEQLVWEINSHIANART
jgi:hypothetical protein